MWSLIAGWARQSGGKQKNRFPFSLVCNAGMDLFGIRKLPHANGTQEEKVSHFGNKSSKRAMSF